MKSELDLISFQYYDGNIRKPVPIGVITLSQFIESHRNPSTEILDVFDRIERATQDGEEKEKNRLKQSELYYFTPSAMFRKGFNRRYENIVSFTGLAQVDIDNLEVDEAVDLKSWLFDNYEEFYCVYLSPSREGVKGLIRIPIVKSIKEFKEYYKGIEDEFDWVAGFDSAPKNLALPLFLSYDTDILWREDAVKWVKKGTLQEDSLDNLRSTPKPSHSIRTGDETVYKSKAYYRKITLEIFDRKLNEITDVGHPVLRSASLVLGSRVGAGYLDRADAEQHAEWRIRNNHYLKKGIDGYVETMKWAIKQGINNPRYYK